MNKTMVYTMAALLSLSALAGCGRMDGGEAVSPTERPMATATPIILTPDPEDGYVRDEDGIITDDDTGPDAGGTAAPRPTMDPSPVAPTASAKPPKGTASPSPSPANGTDMP